MEIGFLEKRTLLGLTEAELREFEERQERIRDLFIELRHESPRTCADVICAVVTTFTLIYPGIGMGAHAGARRAKSRDEV